MRNVAKQIGVRIGALHKTMLDELAAWFGAEGEAETVRRSVETAHKALLADITMSTNEMVLQAVTNLSETNPSAITWGQVRRLSQLAHQAYLHAGDRSVGGEIFLKIYRLYQAVWQDIKDGLEADDRASYEKYALGNSIRKSEEAYKSLEVAQQETRGFIASLPILSGGQAEMFIRPLSALRKYQEPRRLGILLQNNVQELEALIQVAAYGFAQGNGGRPFASPPAGDVLLPSSRVMVGDVLIDVHWTADPYTFFEYRLPQNNNSFGFTMDFYALQDLLFLLSPQSMSYISGGGDLATIHTRCFTMIRALQPDAFCLRGNGKGVALNFYIDHSILNDAYSAISQLTADTYFQQQFRSVARHLGQI